VFAYGKAKGEKYPTDEELTKTLEESMRKTNVQLQEREEPR